MSTTTSKIKEQVKEFSTSLSDETKSESQVFSEKEAQLIAIKEELLKMIEELEIAKAEFKKREDYVEKESKKLLALKIETREIINQYEHMRAKSNNI